LYNPDAFCDTLFNSGKGNTLLINCTKNVIALLGIAGLASFASSAEAVVIFDDFSVSQTTLTAAPASFSNAANLSAPLIFGSGGVRTVTVGGTGNGPVSSVINTMPNTLVFSSGFGVNGFVQLDYALAAPPQFNLGAAAIALSADLAGDLSGAGFTLTLLSSAGASSNLPLLVIPSGSAGTFSSFTIPFASLTGNVDLTAITGVRLRLDGVNSFDGALRLLRFEGSQVPEPGSVALLIGGALSGAVVLRRRRK